MAKKHGTIVKLLSVSPDDHIFRVGEKFIVKVAFLPQNRFPKACTQIFFYVGLQGESKALYKGMNEPPERNSHMQKMTFEYEILPGMFEDCDSRDDFVILEIGWGEESQASWRDAKASFKEKGYEHHLLYTVPVARPWGKKHIFKLGLCTPLPRVVAGGDVLMLDLATILQNNYPECRSLIFVCIECEHGFDVCCIEDRVPEERPPLRRQVISYSVSESLVGQKLKISWGTSVLYNPQDEPVFHPDCKTALGDVKVRQCEEALLANFIPENMQTFLRTARRSIRMRVRSLIAKESTKMILQDSSLATLPIAVCKSVGSQIFGKLAEEFGGSVQDWEDIGGLLGAMGGGAVFLPHVHTGLAAGAIFWVVDKATDKFLKI